MSNTSWGKAFKVLDERDDLSYQSRMYIFGVLRAQEGRPPPTNADPALLMGYEDAMGDPNLSLENFISP